MCTYLLDVCGISERRRAGVQRQLPHSLVPLHCRGELRHRGPGGKERRRGDQTVPRHGRPTPAGDRLQQEQLQRLQGSADALHWPAPGRGQVVSLLVEYTMAQRARSGCFLVTLNTLWHSGPGQVVFLLL